MPAGLDTAAAPAVCKTIAGLVHKVAAPLPVVRRRAMVPEDSLAAGSLAAAVAARKNRKPDSRAVTVVDMNSVVLAVPIEHIAAQIEGAEFEIDHTGTARCKATLIAHTRPKTRSLLAYHQSKGKGEECRLHRCIRFTPSKRNTPAY